MRIKNGMRGKFGKRIPTHGLNDMFIAFNKDVSIST
jgi:hypothetical protein